MDFLNDNLNYINKKVGSPVIDDLTTVSSTKAQTKKYRFSNLSLVPDLVCFSHLRWDFVFQRPQHLLTRFSNQVRVFFIEEPIFEDTVKAHLDVQVRGENLWRATPRLSHGMNTTEINNIIEELVLNLFTEQDIHDFIAWYYTPMALGFTNKIKPVATVYDCMDELSAFAGAPPELIEKENELLAKADLVFTGGISLYEAKRNRSKNVHAFPSSIDRKHFVKAREVVKDPEDQQSIPHPRLGFFGVIDERMDINLVAKLAELKPEWHIILIGPVAKIDPALLPQASNIHYLGMKQYNELPTYLSNWDIAIMPFALNESTKFISPTKTPEFLAAGKPVVSTPVRDVVRTYGERGLVQIASTPEEFVKAVEKAMIQGEDKAWDQEVDSFLSQSSWDQTGSEMTHLICEQILEKNS
jgi:glycosyltransferase involved in cell wall biosynthesis